MENKTSVDEKLISRLHLILAPFMLRRVKKVVKGGMGSLEGRRVNLVD